MKAHSKYKWKMRMAKTLQVMDAMVLQQMMEAQMILSCQIALSKMAMPISLLESPLVTLQIRSSQVLCNLQRKQVHFPTKHLHLSKQQSSRSTPLSIKTAAQFPLA